MTTVQDWHDTIQYQEQGVFIDWIHKGELELTLRKRITQGEYLIASGTAQEIADYLFVYIGKHTRITLLPILQNRLDSLHLRLFKYLH